MRRSPVRNWPWPPPARLPRATAMVPSSCNCCADLYAYYTTVGAGVAGLPLYDTLLCPPIDATNSCTYDIFDKSYALFAYQVALATGQNFTIRNQAGSTSILFYTEWTARGGVTGLGRPVDVESAVTATVIAPATTGTTATVQPYAYGAIYSITSGLNRNSLFTVMQPVYGLYVSSLGPVRQPGRADVAGVRPPQWRPPPDLRRRRHTIHARRKRPGHPAARVHRAIERRFH